MEIVTEMLKETVVPVVKYSVGFVQQQIGYMICYKARVEEMKSKIDFLKDRRDTIQDQVEADGINSVPIKDSVRTWLEDAEKTLEKAKRISENEDAVSKGCLNLKQRYLLGKRASQELQEINNLRQVELDIILSKNQIPLGKVVAAAVLSEKAVHRLPSIIQKDGFAFFGSRDHVYNNVLKALDDDKTCLIAICGMGGVGKTTMIEQLEKTAKEKQMFHWAFKVVVSAQPNIRDIQQEIADFMKLNFDVTSVDSRAERLGKAFKEISEDGRKKILVILDDLWDTLDLKQLGLSPIAFTTAGFKIIFTTRNKHVCTGMNVDDNAIFELGVLTKEEASDLFQKTVDFDNCTDPELPKIAEDIVEECDGLPLAITTIAGALKRKSKSAWIDTLRRLRNSDIGERLNAVLETSFKYLEDDDTREVFRLCCLFPEDYHIPIEELARYATGLRLYEDIHLIDMEDVRNRTKACTEELTGVNLLLESEYEDCVKMHDIVRDFGLNRCKNSWLVKHGNILQWPRQDSKEPYKRISLECSHMDQLPSKMNCPNLELLRLTGNPSSEFPKEFYKGMKKLRVLDYQGMNNPLLPGGSLQVFTNLRTLSLSSCNLGDFSMIGNLKCLEILSFASCGISELPAEIGNLSQLKLLDLTGCMNLHIEEGVLQKLVNLEELYMRSAPLPYSVYKFTDSNCAALGARFEKLTALEFEFYENRVEARPTFFKKLKRFRMSMGCYLDGKDSRGHTPFKNTLMLNTNATELSQSGIHELFKITEVLVFQVENASCICDVSNAKDFWNLKILRVEECKELVHLVDIIGGEPNDVFPVMVNLRLSKLNSLEGIYRSPQSQHSIFRMLKELEVFECNKLRFVLTHSLVKGMSMLEHLEVRSCENIQEIMEEEIMEDIASGRVVDFPNLRSLSLTNLRNLVSFCKAADAGVIQFPQLDKLELDCLPKITSIYQGLKTATTSIEATDFKSVMHPFFNQRVVLPKLEQLNVNEMVNLKEIWPSQYHWEDISLCTITKMRVRKCDSLVYLFPPNQIPQQLHHLELLFCNSLDVIFDIDFRNGNNNNNRIHCHEIEEEEEGCSCLSLTEITVGGCKNFRHVWQMNCVNSDHINNQFKILRSIDVWGCDNFIRLYTPSTANINLEGLESILIFDKKHSGTSESDDVSVEGSRTGGQKMLCEGEIMKQSQAIAFPSYLSWRLQNLQILDLQQCEGVDVAFEIGELSGEFGNGSRQVLLPQLRRLRLWELRNMTHVWKWNKLGPPRQPQASVVVFQNLTNVLISRCYRIKYLFALSVAKHLVGLRSLHISFCDKMQIIVSDIENDDNVDEHEGGQEMEENATHMYMDATLFPQLEKLHLFDVPNLMHIGGGGGKGGRNATGSSTTHGEKLEIDLLCGKSCRDSEGKEHAQVVSFANLRELDINIGDKLVHAIPFYAAGQLLKLEILKIYKCENMVELFEMEEIKSRSDIAEGRGESTRIPRMNMIDLYQLPKLTEIGIRDCDGLIYLFTYSIAQTLKQLKRFYYYIMLKIGSDGEGRGRACYQY